MARLTKQLRNRKAIDPVRKIRENQEAPAWLSNAGVWVGLAAIIVALVVFLPVRAFLSEEPEPSTASGPQAPLQEINPHTDTLPGEDTPDEGDNEDTGSQYANADFTNQETESVPVESSALDSPAPIGAINVARAAAEAMTTGEWEGVPTSRTPTDDRFLGAEVESSSLRLADPIPSSAEETQPMTFIFNGTSEDGESVEFSVTVKLEGDSYEVVIF